MLVDSIFYLKNGGETKLINLNYNGLQIEIEFETDDDEAVILRGSCHVLYSNIDPRGGIFNIGQISTLDPAGLLDVQNGIYVAPQIFHDLWSP